MPATASTIGFCTAETRIATAGPDSGVVSRHGAAARFTSEPIETFFDDLDDVDAVANERLDLLKADRRRFQVTVADAASGLALAPSPVTPTVTFIDTERDADLPALVAEFGIDFETDASVLVVWG